MKARRVVCAAIRAEDGSLIIGLRHYSADMHEQIAIRRDGGNFRHRHGEDQGFVDQWGAYMTRSQAYEVALHAGQILYPACLHGGRDLYSEALY